MTRPDGFIQSSPCVKEAASSGRRSTPPQWCSSSPAAPERWVERHDVEPPGRPPDGHQVERFDLAELAPVALAAGRVATDRTLARAVHCGYRWDGVGQRCPLSAP